MKQYLATYKRHPKSIFLRAVVTFAAALTIFILFSLVAYIIVKGIPNLKPSLFEWEYTSENASMMPALINTVAMVLLTLLLAVPFGIGSAIYLTEYAKRDNKVVPVIRMTTETLSGIPSIVYGLFGYMAFVRAMEWGYSPPCRRHHPCHYDSPADYAHHRRGSSCGAGQLSGGQLRPGRRAAAYHLPGGAAICNAWYPLGVILGIGRIVGETAALIYTAGTVTGVPDSVLSSGRTLAVHMYALLSEGLYTDEAYATQWFCWCSS